MYACVSGAYVYVDVTCGCIHACMHTSLTHVQTTCMHACALGTQTNSRSFARACTHMNTITRVLSLFLPPSLPPSLALSRHPPQTHTQIRWDTETPGKLATHGVQFYFGELALEEAGKGVRVLVNSSAGIIYTYKYIYIYIYIYTRSWAHFWFWAICHLFWYCIIMYTGSWARSWIDFFDIKTNLVSQFKILYLHTIEEGEPYKCWKEPCSFWKEPHVYNMDTSQQPAGCQIELQYVCVCLRVCARVCV